MVAEPFPPSVSGKRRLCASAASCSVCRITPASQTAWRDSVSRPRILFIRRSDSRIALPLLSGVAPPHMPLLPPCGTIAMRWRAHRATIAAVSSVEAGEAMASAAPVNLPRQSVSHGSIRSVSRVKPRGPQQGLGFGEKCLVVCHRARLCHRCFGFRQHLRIAFRSNGGLQFGFPGLSQCSSDVFKPGGRHMSRLRVLVKTIRL